MAPTTTEAPLRTEPAGKSGGAAASLVLADDRPADTVAFEHAVVEFFTQAAGMLGVPKSVAAIYGMVFASPRPLSFADLGARLDLSNGSISQGLRVLREIGALQEVSTAADRAERFAPDIELRRLIRRYLENRLAKQLAAGGDQLQRIGRALPRGAAADTAVLRSRLRQLRNWNSKARALLPVARTFLQLIG